MYGNTPLNTFGITHNVEYDYEGYLKSITDNLDTHSYIDSSLNEFLGIKNLNNIQHNNSYLNQKYCLKALFNNEDILNFDVNEYHQFINDNSDFIDDNLYFVASSFQHYLDDYKNRFISFKTGAMLDLKYNIALNEPICLIKPILRFFENYKLKKMSHILNFSKFINMYNKNPNDDIFKSPDSLELLNIINSPCLFITLTMGNDKPLKTALKYKNGWKGFYNNLRHLSKRYGFNIDYFIKGVEFTKKNRLHIHLLILNVHLDTNTLPEFKKDFENILNLSNFGYINDITYLKDGYTYIMKSLRDLNKLKASNKFNSIKPIKSFNLTYDGNKTASFKLLECKYNHKKDFKTDSSTKIINYIFKYILKSTPYDKLEKDKHIKRYILNNCIFWLTGIKKFDISRKLSSLLKSFNDKIKQVRFKFFNNDRDLKAFLKNKPVDAPEFERGFISSDDLERVYNLYPYTALGLYLSLGLEVSEYLKNIRFKKHFILSDNLEVV